MAKVGQYRPGEILNITVFENGKQKDYSLRLRNVYGNTEIISEDNNSFVKELGATFEKPDKQLMKHLHINKGMQISALKQGTLSKKGIHNGFIILKMNKVDIKSLKDIRRVIHDVNGGLLIEGIYPNGMRVYYGIGL